MKSGYFKGAHWSRKGRSSAAPRSKEYDCPTPLLRREAGELVPLAVEGGLLGTTDFLTAH